MGIYIALFVTILIMLLLENFYKTIKIGRLNISCRSVAFLIIFIFILSLGIFKGEEYGYDTYSYKTFYFDYMKNITFVEAMKRDIEPGFALLSFVLSRLTTHFWVFRAIIFLISFGGIAKVIWDRSEIVSYSFLIYISFGLLSVDYSILRQAIAITIIFMGYKYLENGSYIKFFFIILFAMTFHTTAIVALFLLPLTMTKFKNSSFLKKCIYVIGAIFVGAYIMPRFIGTYTRKDYLSVAVSGEGYGLLISIILLFIFMGYFKTHYSNEEGANNSSVLTGENVKNNNGAIYDFCFASIYMQIIALFFSLFTRAIFYPLVYLLITLPNIASKLDKGAKGVFLFAISLLAFAIFYKSILSAPDLIPYISIFS